MAKDELDQKIIEILKKNSRESNVAIAKAVGLTEGAVRRRIGNLLTRGVIKRFSLELASGNEIFAIVMAKSKGDTKRMLADVLATGIPKEAYEISGEFDACIVISGNSMEEIDREIDKIRKCASVAGTKTFMSLHSWKV